MKVRDAARRQQSRNLGKKLVSYLRGPAPTGMVALAVLVGIGSGYGAVVFRWLISTAHAGFFEGLRGALPWLGRYYVILVPALGGLLVGLLVYFLAQEAKGHGVPEVMMAVMHKGGRIRPRVAVIKSLASAICIGSGGSVGREGPIVQIGSALGSTMGQILKLSDERIRVLVACGAAGGISATFNAPIAGVLFALEVILRDFSIRSFGLVVLSSVSSLVISHIYLGDHPAFTIAHPYALVSAWELPLYFLLGLMAGLVGRGFIWIMYRFEDVFEAWSFPEYLKPVVGGLAVGTIGVWYPQVFGVGYETIDAGLAAKLGVMLLWTLVLLKPLATSLTIGSGGSGGVFAPSLFIGCMLGGAFGDLVHGAYPAVTATGGAYALVGMGAVFAGAAHAPMTAIIILFEMTGDYRIIGPLMIATVVSSLLSEFMSRESIYTLKLSRRGVDVIGARPDLLATIPVAEAMTTEFDSISPETPVSDAMERLARGEVPSLPVVDGDGTLVGIVSRSDAEQAILEDQMESPASEIMTPNPVTCFVDESLTLALQRQSALGAAALPVLDPSQGDAVVGMLRRRDIIAAYQQARTQRPELVAQIDRLSGSVPGAGVVEMVVAPNSPAADRPIRSLSVPPDTLLVAVRQGARSVIPHGETVLRPGDRVIALADREQLPALRKLFARAAEPE
ncbi:MAG: chloride channel protein [Armatimonadota bacterium]|nr:chloride channel protein [Armatimonadota bacterium]